MHLVANNIFFLKVQLG